MAIVGMPLNSTPVVVYQTGLTSAGGPILSQKSQSDNEFGLPSLSGEASSFFPYSSQSCIQTVEP